MNGYIDMSARQILEVKDIPLILTEYFGPENDLLLDSKAGNHDNYRQIFDAIPIHDDDKMLFMTEEDVPGGRERIIPNTDGTFTEDFPSYLIRTRLYYSANYGIRISINILPLLKVIVDVDKLDENIKQLIMTFSYNFPQFKTELDQVVDRMFSAFSEPQLEEYFKTEFRRNKENYEQNLVIIEQIAPPPEDDGLLAPIKAYPTSERDRLFIKAVSEYYEHNLAICVRLIQVYMKLLSVYTIQRMYKERKAVAKEKLIQLYRDYLCEMSEDNQFTVPVPESLESKYGNPLTLQCNPGSEAGAPWTIGQPLTHDEITELYLDNDGPPLPEQRDIFGLSSSDFADQREINRRLTQRYSDVLCQMSEPEFTVDVPESLEGEYGNPLTLQCNPGSQAGPPWTIGNPLKDYEIRQLYLHNGGPELHKDDPIFDLPSSELNKIRKEISELKKELQPQAGGYVVRPIFY